MPPSKLHSSASLLPSARNIPAARVSSTNASSTCFFFCHWSWCFLLHTQQTQGKRYHRSENSLSTASRKAATPEIYSKNPQTSSDIHPCSGDYSFISCTPLMHVLVGTRPPLQHFLRVTVLEKSEHTQPCQRCSSRRYTSQKKRRFQSATATSPAISTLSIEEHLASDLALETTGRSSNERCVVHPISQILSGYLSWP